MAPALASVWVPADRIGRDHRGQAGGDGRHGEGDRGQEQLLEGLVAPEAEADGDEQRDAGDDEDLVGQLVELLGERRLLVLGVLEHAADVADLGGHAGRGHERGCRRRG